MTGAEMIAAERDRQIDTEGYEVEDDVRLNPYGELAMAALCYLYDYAMPAPRGARRGAVKPEWPWHSKEFCSWKPTPGDPVRQLVKAGALIAAEIDRLLA